MKYVVGKKEIIAMKCVTIAIMMFTIVIAYKVEAHKEIIEDTVSKEVFEILVEQEDEEQEDEIIEKSNILIAALDREVEDVEEKETTTTQTTSSEAIKTTSSGYKYQVQATISIPKIGVNQDVVIGQTGTVAETEALLKQFLTRFWGAEPNEVGNYCIAGHNYWDTRFFSKVPTLEKGDLIYITDVAEERTITYEVYEKKIVEIDDVSDTSQKTEGKKEVTLITCTNDSSGRYIIKAREV